MYAGTRLFLDEQERSWRRVPAATLLLLAAVLAKSVAIIAILPLLSLSVARFGWLQTLRRPHTWVVFLGALIPFALYDRYESSIAEWKWASGITKLHVIPSLLGALTSSDAFLTKWTAFMMSFTMLAHTMLGPVIFTLLILAFLTPLRSRAPMMLVGWLAADVVYAYLVVTVERVDYYLYPFVPLAALVGGAYLAQSFDADRFRASSRAIQRTIIAGISLALITTVCEARQEIAPYYAYNPSILRQARILDTLLPKDALIVQGHLDPSLLYYIHRHGWEEDPYLWTPFDEQSAIRKGSRYFIAAESNRLAHNVELNAWLARFPLLDTPPHTWHVYVTDPDRQVPGAEKAWRTFRDHEKQGKLKAASPDEDPTYE